MFGTHRHAVRKFRYKRAGKTNTFGERDIVSGINYVRSSAQHRDTFALCIERSFVSRCIDAGGQTAGNSEARPGQVRGKFSRVSARS